MLNAATHDLSFLRDRFADAHPGFAADFDEIAKELGKFLAMPQKGSAGPLAVMSHRVDELWHTFIHHTPQYVEFCNAAYGGYLHHQPRSDLHPVPASAISNFYTEYPKHYGKVPTMWLEDLPPKCCNGAINGEVPPELLEMRWSGWPGWK